MKFRKALFIRLDRIGDLVLSLPVDQLSFLKDVDVTWAISPGMEFIAENAVPVRKHVSFSRKFEIKNFLAFYKYVRREKFDLSVVFHGPWWAAFALWLAGIKVRVGAKSQWYSFLFYNRGVRQKRSHALFHESEYNRRLLVSGLRLHGTTETVLPLKLRVSEHDYSKKLGLRFAQYFVVHPGMAGSARNWTTPLYVELIKRLTAKDNVLITFSKSDHRWVEPILENFVDHPRLQYLELSDADDWRYVLSSARAVLAPSTGTAHISAALGTPTVGLYSPVKVQAPKRWAPLGDSVRVVWPDVECPGHKSCLMENCPRFDCMRDISVEEVFQALMEMSRKDKSCD